MSDGDFGEPWRVVVDHDEHACYFETSHSAEHIEGTLRQNTRIVKCVNAMAGIPYPGAFMERHRALVEASNALVTFADPHGENGAYSIVKTKCIERLEAALAAAEESG